MENRLETRWRDQVLFSKFSDTYISRELADRDSLLQFEIYYHNSLLLLNGLASTVILGTFNAKLGNGSEIARSDLYLVGAAALFILGAICAIFAGAALARSRLRFMLLWGAKLRRHLGCWRNPDTGKSHHLVNDPGALEKDDFIDNISSEDKNIQLALRHSLSARILATFSSVLFCLGLVTSLFLAYSLVIHRL